MSAHLVFLFFFQGGLALAFSYFIVRVLTGGLNPKAHQSMLNGIRKIRMVVIAAGFVFPLVMFAAYYKSLPEGKSISLAIWPAVWILVIMLSLSIGISLGMRPGKSKEQDRDG